MSRAEVALGGPLSSPLSDPVPPSVATTADHRLRSGERARWTGAEEARLRQAFDEHFGFVWRYLRRLGLRDSDADDATQQVYMVMARRLACIDEGRERSFLCGTAVRVASEHRRAAGRRRELPSCEICEPQDGAVGPDELVDRRRARALLDEVLDEMPMDLRAVFVLFELEEVPVARIAELLDLPTGTAASRLRRARESFRGIVKRCRARGTLPGEES